MSEESESDRRSPFVRTIARHPWITAFIVLVVLVGLLFLFWWIVTRFITSTIPPNRIGPNLAEMSGRWYVNSATDQALFGRMVTVSGTNVKIANGTSDESYDIDVNANGTMSVSGMHLLKFWYDNWTIVHKTPTCMAITGTDASWYMIWHRSDTPPDADIAAAESDLAAIGAI